MALETAVGSAATMLRKEVSVLDVICCKRAFSAHLRELASLQVRQQEAFVGVRHHVAVDLGVRVGVDVNLSDLLPELGLDHVRVLRRAE